MGYTAAIVDQTYIYIKMVFSSTMYFPRLICTCFCCERILATIFVERYEKSREFFRYTVLIFMLLVPVAIFQTISYNILRIPVNIIYAFSITVTTTNAVAVHLLYRINKKHRKNRAALQLTHKFQIEENIRVLNLFYYQMVLEVFFGYLAIGSAIFIDKCFNNLTALNVVYFTMYNFYVICVSLYWITRNQAIRASLYHSFTGKRLPVDSNVVEHKNGERHFNDLRNAWK
uniref:Gustatory receptor n=1 Tax=Panagrolaimus sp. JU765 TaxID=591449 RepID=A0AC34RKG2_9BILA